MNWYGTEFSRNSEVREISVISRLHTRDSGFQDTPQPFCDNTVLTAKYNVVTFLPIALFEQFRRLANIYFLFITVLMLIGTYTTLFETPLSPWSEIVVLMVVISVSMGKSAVEDMKRHDADNKMNYAVVRRLNRKDLDLGSNEFEQVQCQDVQVGDFLYLVEGQEVPADVILLTSSEPFGCVYIETSNIDGEANLKVKNSAPSGQGGHPAWNTVDELRRCSMEINCEHPNSAIHSFSGVLKFAGSYSGNRDRSSDTQAYTSFANGGHDMNRGRSDVPLSISNFILRGSSLRNTRWAIGVVAYTGKETKLVMNSRKPPFKMSFIERTMNNIIIVFFIAQIILSVLSMVLHMMWTDTNFDRIYYLCYDATTLAAVDSALYEECLTDTVDYSEGSYFFTFFILYSNVLPISMYVTVEICNMFQAHFIDSDTELYDVRTNTPAVARTSTMNADLGMVEFVFSDKTGTLTDNEMNFKRCTIGGLLFGGATKKRAASEVDMDSTIAAPPVLEGLPLRTLVAASAHTNNNPLADFVLLMAVCHTVFIDAASGVLQSESPDEEALVRGAAELGWSFTGRKLGMVCVGRDDQQLQYQLLATIPFDSTRKRMSVVVKAPNGKILVLCKGADNIILSRSTSILSLPPSVLAEHGHPDAYRAGNDPRATLMQHLEAFATDGLRTLVLAHRELDAQTFVQFQALWSQAEAAIIGKGEIMREAADLIERDLTVLGATGIEDKLQDGVEGCIEDLKLAGVRLWVLTGDKVETAINIGYSSKLLVPEMYLIRLQDKGESLEDIKKLLRAITLKFKSLLDEKKILEQIRASVKTSIREVIYGPGLDDRSGMSPLDRDGAPFSSDDWSEDSPFILKPQNFSISLSQIASDHLALILDGDLLTKLMGDAEAEQMLLAIGMICKCVLACRVSPEQKRLLVKLVKTQVSPRPVTLSIGDGANDVAMIQEAQIGVGISGKEGRQAVNSSDFAIAQFRYLKRLMLVHGRTDYRRICKVVLYSFYKNVVMTLILWIYTYYSGYSGQSLFDSNVHSAYNLILAWPVVAMGVFDCDVSAQFLLSNKLMYAGGRKRSDLNVVIVLEEMAQASFDAIIIYFIPYAAYNESRDIWTSNGYGDGVWVFGTVVYTVLVAAMFGRIANLTYSWTVWTHLCFWGSAALYVLFLATYQYYVTLSWNFYSVFDQMAGESVFWLLLVLTPTVSILADITIRMIKKEYFPTINDIGREIDNGESEFTELLPRAKKNSLSPQRDGAKGPDADRDDTDSSGTDPESELRFASAFSPNQGNEQIYPLDWKAVQKLFHNFKVALDNRPKELEGGLSNTFNFDHIVATGVDGWKNLVSFPLIFGSISTFNLAPPSTESGSGAAEATNSAAQENNVPDEN